MNEDPFLSDLHNSSSISLPESMANCLTNVQNSIKSTAQAMIDRIRELEMALLMQAEATIIAHSRLNFQNDRVAAYPSAPLPEKSFPASPETASIEKVTLSATSEVGMCESQLEEVTVSPGSQHVALLTVPVLHTGVDCGQVLSIHPLEFKVNMESMLYVTNILSLGTLINSSQPIPRPTPRTAHRLRWAQEVKANGDLDLGVKVAFLGKLNTKSEEDLVKPHITGAVIMAMKEMTVLVVVDQANKCLKAFQGMEFDQLYSHLQFLGEPLAIARLKETKLVVTLPGKKKLVVCKLYPKLYKRHKISVRKQYLGVTALSATTMAVSAMWPNSCLDILDLHGRILTSISSDPQCPELVLFSHPFFLCTTPKGQVVMSDSSEKKTVWCFTSEGEVEWSYKPRQSDLSGVTCTVNGEVLVADRGQSAVYLLSPEGRAGHSVIIDNNYIDEPMALHYSSSGYLFVAQTDGQIKFFSFQKSSKE